MLPGYPTAVSTRGESLSEIQEFCRENDRFRGDVTDKMIENSDLITRERVYRAKVFSTTDDFAYQSQILPNWSRWQWTTQWGIDTEELLTNVIFDEGAAHNAVVARSRNWLETHPTIDWACAPHVMGAPVGEQAESRFSPLSPNSDPPEGPVWMFDFAGFEERQYPRLAVVGFVIDDESDTEIMEQIARAAQISIPTVLVFPRRPAIIDFIDTVYSRGWLDSDAVSLDDVTEYYRSHPSIPAINATFSDQLGIENLRFVSRKQIIDDVIDPGDVFPQRILRGDE